MQVREKGRKVAKHCVFPMIWGSGGSKSRLAKAAGAESSGRMRGKKCTIDRYFLFIEGSLEVKLPTIWTDEKQSREEAERRKRLEERKVEEKK